MIERVVPRAALAALLLPTLLSVPSPADPPAAESPRSPRNANYTIDARLEPAMRTLAGRQILTWTNLQERPAEELWFHLYWNAWRNDRSTWMLEDALAGRREIGDRPRDDDWGFIEVESVRLLAADDASAPIDLGQARRFESPDDGNPDDRTVLVVDLPRPVERGATVRVEMTWRARVPRFFARTGFRGDYWFLAHWFPKLGVYEPSGWNCHQFHASTEFFSDYGVYDVSLTLPEHYVVGATGREAERRDNADATTTHRYVQEDVHGFSWTASKEYVERESRFEVPGLPPVAMRLLLQPEHLGQAERHFDATRAALERYGRWYGPYPYGHVTVIDPAYGSDAGGMEYPTLFTAGTRLFAPFGGDRPESVIVHEAGHQFWYGIVGNNEFEHAWIDEGLNTFSTQRVLDDAFGDRIYVQRYLRPPGKSNRRDGFIPIALRDVKVPRFLNRLDRYRPDVGTDDPDTASYRYHPGTGRSLTYSKTALWLVTLERHLGWETLQRILSTFFERHAFGHPTPDDFFAVADEVSGQDLAWFFDQVQRDSVRFDYAIDSVSSEPVRLRGFVDAAGEPVLAEENEDADDATGLQRSEVVVRRLGEGRFPVEVLLVFEDGSERRERWDGQDRWKLFVVEREGRLDYAVIDPDRVLVLDLNYTNNSRRVESAATLPAVKWGSRWMVWFQDLLAAFAFFI